MTHARLALTALALAGTVSAQAVLTVDDDGPADFSEITAAIDAAAPGDTILVRSGAYAGFAIAGKGLHVVADRDALVLTDFAVVQSVGAGERVVIAGLRVANIGALPALAIVDCAGLVWIRDCELKGVLASLFGPGKALEVIGSDNVVLERCSIEGAPSIGGTQAGGVGMTTSASNVHLLASQVEGGAGGLGGPSTSALSSGGIACVVSNGGFLYAGSSTIAGGTGGPGGVRPACTDGGDGAEGLLLTTGAPTAVLFDSKLAGGTGGLAGGPGCADGATASASFAATGTIQATPGPRRSLEVSTPLREGETAEFRVTGEPGELAWIATSLAGEVRWAPGLGVDLLGETLFLVLVGPLDANGAGGANAEVPAFPPGVDVYQLFHQALHLDPRDGLALGHGQVATYLDASF